MLKRFREYNLALLLTAVSALLGVVLLAQWINYRHQQANLKKLLDSKVETHMEAQKLEEHHFELPGLEDYSATVERPLFMEGRRPATEDASEPEAVAVEKKPLTVKLMGVVFAPKETLGLFVDAQGKYKRLRINESIGGWKVSGIEPDKAIMEQDGTREELKLAKPKQKKPTPGQPRPGGPNAGPPPFGGPPGAPMQPVPPFGAFNPNNPNMPEQPIDTEQPNEAIDETATPPEEPLQNDQ